MRATAPQTKQVNDAVEFAREAASYVSGVFNSGLSRADILDTWEEFTQDLYANLPQAYFEKRRQLGPRADVAWAILAGVHDAGVRVPQDMADEFRTVISGSVHPNAVEDLLDDALDRVETASVWDDDAIVEAEVEKQSARLARVFSSEIAPDEILAIWDSFQIQMATRLPDDYTVDDREGGAQRLAPNITEAIARGASINARGGVPDVLEGGPDGLASNQGFSDAFREVLAGEGFAPGAVPQSVPPNISPAP